MGLARSAARPVLKLLPGVKQRLAEVAGKVTRPVERASFTAAQAKESLERSLVALRTDRIDIWLLHEVEASDLSDDGLLRLLEDLVAHGTIGTFGIGSDGSKVADLLGCGRSTAGRCSTSGRCSTASPAQGGPFRIHHRALTDNFRSLHAALLGRPEICRQWSAEVGVDLSGADALAGLMLKASLAMNPESIILFSSKRPEHIRANVAVANDASLEAPAKRLYELAQARRDELLGVGSGGG